MADLPAALLKHIASQLCPAGQEWEVVVAPDSLQPGGMKAGLRNQNTVLLGIPLNASNATQEHTDKYLFRLYPNDNVKIGGSSISENEVRVLQLLETLQPGLAPRLLLSGPAGSHDAPAKWSVLEYIPNSGALGPHEVSAHANNAVAILARLHSTHEQLDASVSPFSSEPEDLNVVPDAETLGKGFTTCPAAMDPGVAARVSAAWSLVLEKTSENTSSSTKFAGLPRTAFIHRDAHCGNFLKRAKEDGSVELQLIDWEGAGLGSELEDLATLFTVTYPPLSTEKELEIVNHYRAQASPEIQALVDNLQREDSLVEMLSLFKVRKLCRMISFFNSALVDAENGKEGGMTDAGRAQMTGGVAFFLGTLEGILSGVLK